MYSNELVCSILDFIDININRKISIDEIASRFFYNRYYIMKLFKREMGISIANYINYMRIRTSLRDINNYNYSITRVALNNGFYSLEYFSETFHKVMGVNPRVYLYFCKYKFKVSEKNLEIININLIKIQELVEKVDKYQKNKKPVGIPVLKRTIFK